MAFDGFANKVEAVSSDVDMPAPTSRAGKGDVKVRSLFGHAAFVSGGITIGNLHERGKQPRHTHSVKVISEGRRHSQHRGVFDVEAVHTHTRSVATGLVSV